MLQRVALSGVHPRIRDSTNLQPAGLLVVHDGSTDDSIEVAERVAVAARLGFKAAVSRDEALGLTRDWAKSARLI